MATPSRMRQTKGIPGIKPMCQNGLFSECAFTSMAAASSAVYPGTATPMAGEEKEMKAVSPCVSAQHLHLSQFLIQKFR
jgi:hypothetical protein